VTFQQRFAQSDDAAQVMTRAVDSLRVDASGASLGTLVELLMLRRTAGRRVSVADSSSRGRMLRRLLASRRLFVSDGACGAIHRPAGGNAATDAASSDFAKSFQTQLASAGVQATAAGRLSAALHELLTNIDEHAGDAVDGLGAFEVMDREAWMVVADSGRGVLAGYVESPLPVRPATAEEALTWAVIENRSRTGDPQRGLGFRSVIQSVRSLDGCVRVRSDSASLELVQAGDRPKFLVREQGHLRGFVVSVQLRW
jgi:anti-sigma regulatory factor (Ser/Thr protein kinase)